MSDEDCIIDGGGALDIPCEEESQETSCWESDTPPANIWNPRIISRQTANAKQVEERLVATANQVLFTLTEFEYALDTGSLVVFKNGKILAQGFEWAEISSSKFQLVTPCVSGDVIIALGHTDIVANVDVRDTDIYIDTYQNIRDYGGTEETLYALGHTVDNDGAGDFFQYISGYAPGTFVDNGKNILLPTGGDGSACWYRKVAALVFNTVADMVAYPAYKIGDTMQTLGYRTIGDNGHNNYRVVAAATFTADGGAFINLTTANLQAVALFLSLKPNVKQWGTYTDLVSNDSPAIQAAINTAAAFLEGILEFPTGNPYLCNITVPGFMTLRGTSGTAQLKPFANAPTIQTDPALDVYDVLIENFVINGLDNIGVFTSNHGILVQPNSNKRHAKIRLNNMLINYCGGGGISLIGGNVSSSSDRRIAGVSIDNCQIAYNVLPGLHIKQNVGNVVCDNTLIADNGDRLVSDENNVVIEGTGFVVPDIITFDGTEFSTPAYAAAGTDGATVVIIGAVGVSFDSCVFSEFNSGMDVKLGLNVAVSVRGCRFKRVAAGAVQQLALIEGIVGLIWEGNIVDGPVTGAYGVLLNPFGAYVLKNISIGTNNFWGSLTLATNDNIFVLVTANEIDLINQSGEVPLQLAAPGATNLNTINDVNGNSGLILAGSIINLYSTGALFAITVKHNVGNILLAGGVDMPLTTPNSTLTLMWNSRLMKWVELSRAVIP